MTKYCIRWHDNTFFGTKFVHKKSGSFLYHRYISFSKTSEFSDILLFDTPFQAKMWIMSKSSMPKFAEYAFQMTEPMLDKLIAKGKYTLGKAWMRKRDLNTSTCEFSVEHDKQKYPLLCELSIDEYVV